jgi:hypothetical protein
MSAMGMHRQPHEIFANEPKQLAMEYKKSQRTKE